RSCAKFNGRRHRGLLSLCKGPADEDHEFTEQWPAVRLVRSLQILTGGGNNFIAHRQYADGQLSQVDLAQCFGCDRTTIARRIKRMLEAIRREIDLPEDSNLRLAAWAGALAILSHADLRRSRGCTTDPRELELVLCPTPVYVF